MTQPALTSPFVPSTAQASTAAQDDRRFVIYGVPWPAYVALRDALDDRSGLRLTYLEGTLEFMSPSRDHEDYKKLIARLLEAYAEERDIDLRGFGGATFRKEAKQRGLEPDECYSLGPLGEVPDIAIEVIVSSGLVDKLDVYRGLGVPEVWVYKEGQLLVLHLTGGGYEPRTASFVLPDLNLPHLVRFIAVGENQTQIVKAYRRSLNERIEPEM